MAVGVIDRKKCLKTEARSLPTEPNLALIDYSDGIWVCDSFSSICAAIKDRYIKTNKRFQQVTSADILACIKFEDVGQEELKRKKRRVRFSTGTSISDDSVVHCNGDHQLKNDKESERNVSEDKTERFIPRFFFFFFFVSSSLLMYIAGLYTAITRLHDNKFLATFMGGSASKYLGSKFWMFKFEQHKYLWVVSGDSLVYRAHFILFVV